MMSGMYLGELVRYIMKDFCERGWLFTKNELSILGKKGRFKNFISSLQIYSTDSIYQELASGWLFSEIPNLDLGDSGSAFLISGFGFFLGLWIFIHGIRDFYPRDFRKISGIYAKSLGFGIFYLWDRDFFRWMGYPDKKLTLVSNPESI